MDPGAVVTDRTGQVWEDPFGRLHLIVGPPRRGSIDGSVIHPTLRLLSGKRSSVTDMPGRQLEDREGWSKLA